MLTVHRSETATGLVEALAETLSDSPPDPFTTEVISVPTRGIERWIAQELTSRLAASHGPAGIAANIDFPSPRRLLDAALAAARNDTEDPWQPERLLWTVLDAIDAGLHAPWMAVPRIFVTDENGTVVPGRRLAAAQKLTRLFTRYELERPELIQAWASGDDVGPSGEPLTNNHRWQAVLWRQVRERVGTPSPAEQLDETLTRVALEPELLDLPDRVSFYGLTALPDLYVRTLAAIAENRQVHAFVLHPSRDLWDRTIELLARSPQEVDQAAVNPLLRSWGGDVRELHALIAPHADEVAHHEAERPASDSTLRQVQTHLGANVLPAPGSGTADRTIEVHSCHGPSRQVEVARDAILHALADDPTLEPRDIVVMCPDIETFAPLVQAAFHPDRTGGIPDIRIRTADRSSASENQLAGLATKLFELAGSRITGSYVIELLHHPSVRTRFRLDDDTVASLTQLIDDIGVRWGIDADHRADWGVDGRSEHTWDDALERLRTGVFASDRRAGLVGGRVMPINGVEGEELGLAGVLSEVVSRLGWLVAEAREPAPVSEWRALVEQAVDLFGDSEWDSQWERPALSRELDELFGDQGTHQPHLDLADVTTLLSPLAEGRPSRGNHRTGDLTVCTLVPMRSVPHRVIVLLGMDDGRFPRNPARDGDDLLAHDAPSRGRDPASEDRQLLLDAVMAAEDRLIITYSGRDEHSNAALPPAVPIAELMDVLDVTLGVEPGEDRPFLVDHPLQGFDPRNFADGVLTDGRWGFDRHMLAGATALGSQEPEARAPIGPAPLTPPREVAVDELVSFFDHPVRTFVSRRLGFTMRDEQDDRVDLLPIDLDPLGKYAVGQLLVDGTQDGHDRNDLWTALRAGRMIPLGTMAENDVADVEGTVDAILQSAAEMGIEGRAVGSRRVEVPDVGGVRVVGAVGGLDGPRLLRVQFSRVQPKHRVSMYVRLLALTATDPDRQWEGCLVGRGERGAPVHACTVHSDGGSRRARLDWAVDRLAALIDLFRRGIDEPIPLFSKTSHLLAVGARERELRQAWETDRFAPERDDPHHALAFGGHITLEEMLALPVPEDERGDGWWDSESRAEVLAHRLWDPILEIEDSP